MRMLIIPVILIFILFILAPVSGEPVYISDSDTFRPVYSTSLTGFVSPDHPLKIDLDIRDSETGFVRVYAWGENGTDWSLNGGAGTGSYIVSDPSAPVPTGYPKVLTLRNLTNEYILLDPGIYPLLFESDGSSGDADVRIEYVYHDQIDMGLIEDQTESSWVTTIPEGLKRVIFMTESVYGTDLNLYIYKGGKRTDSNLESDYRATSTCTTCWDTGIEHYLAEMLVIEDPEPGQYEMVTTADGGDDYFYSYWIGVEEEAGEGE